MIYIVLPVYNEEQTIASVVRGIRKHLKNRKHRFVIINDGSIDKTLLKIKALDSAGTTVLSYPINGNIGAVFSTGIEYIVQVAGDNDSMVILESDGTSDPSLITKIAEGIPAIYDVTIASRYRAGGGYRDFPLSRLLFSKAASLVMRKMFPVSGVLDYTIFFRAYSVKFLKQAVKNYGAHGLIRGIGFVANAELLIRLSFLGARCHEIPFLYDYGRKKSRSKLGLIQTLLEYFVTLIYLLRVKRGVETRKNMGLLSIP